MVDSLTGTGAGAQSNVPELSVGELSQAVKGTLERAFGLVRVRGEISQFKRHSSGHVYLCLKDTDAVIDAVIWRGTAGRLGFKPEDGIEVVCTGRVTTYPGRSKYQLIIERMELAGEGALLKMIEDRKRRLAAEGLFDEARKKRLPFLPDVIGVVTSPTGAVIRDILHRLNDRFPRHVLVWPVAVQGDGAAEQVAAAIRGFNELKPGGTVPRPDLLIVARGGGSLEDLMAFNEEIVVRAAAESTIPLISAVGHETDTTLIDFASDRRAPTPTAAAEMAVPVRADLLGDVLRDTQRLVAGYQRLLDERRLQVDGLGRALGRPGRLVEEGMQRLDERTERLRLAWSNLYTQFSVRVASLGERLPHPSRQFEQARATLAERVARLAAGRTAMARTVAQGRDRAAELGQRMDGAFARLTDQHVRRLSHAGQMLESLSYERVLDRGFVLVHGADGRAVTAAKDAKPGAALTLRFHDGKVGAQVDGGAPRPAKGPRAGRPDLPYKQGTLL